MQFNNILLVYDCATTNRCEHYQSTYRSQSYTQNVHCTITCTVQCTYIVKRFLGLIFVFFNSNVLTINCLALQFTKGKTG